VSVSGTRLQALLSRSSLFFLYLFLFLPCGPILRFLRFLHCLQVLPGITIRKLLSLKEGLTSPSNSQSCVVVRDPSAGPASQELSQELCPTEENGSTSGPLLKAIRVGPVTVEEARRAKEVMLVGSGVLVMPVVEWDGRPVNDGEENLRPRFTFLWHSSFVVFLRWCPLFVILCISTLVRFGDVSRHL
jgi:hypothetical protein